MSTLSLRFPSLPDFGGIDSLAKTLHACSKVAASLEYGQRLDNISKRLYHLQKPIVDRELDSPLADLASTTRPRRTPSRASLTSSKRVDSGRKAQPALKFPSLFNDDFSPSALLSASNTVEIPLTDLVSPSVPLERPISPPKAAPVQASTTRRTAAPPKKSSATASAAVQSTPGTSVNAADIAGLGGKAMCANCGATHTPLWRRGLNDELNCNACGLYCKLHKRPRPRGMKVGASNGNAASATAAATQTRAPAYVAPVTEAAPTTVAVCHNCHTTTTPLWRKNEEGHNVCNACGLYHKLHGEARPVSMKSDVIRKRSRQEPASRNSKAVPMPVQRQYTKPAQRLKVNTTPVSYERSSSLSAGATPQKRSFGFSDEEESGRKRMRSEGDVANLLGELQALESTLESLQRRGEDSGRISSRNSDFGDATDVDGYASDVDMDRERRRHSEYVEADGYDRRSAYESNNRTRFADLSLSRPSPLRQLVEAAEAAQYAMCHPSSVKSSRQAFESRYEQHSRMAPGAYSAASSAPSSPPPVDRDVLMSQRTHSPSPSVSSADGYYMSHHLAKDVNPAYARIPSEYEHGRTSSKEAAVARRYHREVVEMV